MFPLLSLVAFIVIIQLLSHVWLFATLWTAALQVPLSYTVSQSWLKLMSIELVMLSNYLILCHFLLLLLSVFPSIKVFSTESALFVRWPKHWSFNFSISPFSEYSGLISFRIDWFDLLAVWGTPKSLLQHHSLKASILWVSTFFIVQLPCLYITTGKTIALTIWVFVGKVTSLLFNIVSRFVTAVLLRSKHLLISRLQPQSAMILEPPKIKSDTVSTVSLYFPWSDGNRCHDLRFLNVEL